MATNTIVTNYRSPQKICNFLIHFADHVVFGPNVMYGAVSDASHCSANADAQAASDRSVPRSTVPACRDATLAGQRQRNFSFAKFLIGPLGNRPEVDRVQILRSFRQK